MAAGRANEHLLPCSPFVAWFRECSRTCPYTYEFARYPGGAENPHVSIYLYKRHCSCFLAVICCCVWMEDQ